MELDRDHHLRPICKLSEFGFGVDRKKPLNPFQQRPTEADVSSKETTARLDEAVDDFVKRTRIFNEDITLGRARMFVLQHRQNTRYRNSVLKLRVATNCPVWDIKLGILEACSEEIIADHASSRFSAASSATVTMLPGRFSQA